MNISTDTLLWVGSMSLPLLGGLATSVITIDQVDNWYPKLKKPWFTPPKYLFGPIWTLLYLAMGKAFYIVIQNRDDDRMLLSLTCAIYVAQMVLNWAWSPLFFLMKRPDLALVDISVMTVLVVACVFTFGIYSTNAAKLMVPYLGFSAVATTVNYVVLKTNDPTLLRGDVPSPKKIN
ncbi:hypothetical protein NDN08_006458 [Rhodosorus marinus]|uniref:Uncharacterized protein n=1 Tax=Rhodosorus marinus TaxID=101924 RepID=A0AAV8UHS0_9RHOD|nr:hypothetical protein NDN08_006458 [Rhodosorus marinus]